MHGSARKHGCASNGNNAISLTPSVVSGSNATATGTDNSLLNFTFTSPSTALTPTVFNLYECIGEVASTVLLNLTVSSLTTTIGATTSNVVVVGFLTEDECGSTIVTKTTDAGAVGGSAVPPADPPVTESLYSVDNVRRIQILLPLPNQLVFGALNVVKCVQCRRGNVLPSPNPCFEIFDKSHSSSPLELEGARIESTSKICNMHNAYGSEVDGSSDDSVASLPAPPRKRPARAAAVQDDSAAVSSPSPAAAQKNKDSRFDSDSDNNDNETESAPKEAARSRGSGAVVVHVTRSGGSSSNASSSSSNSNSNADKGSSPTVQSNQKNNAGSSKKRLCARHSSGGPSLSAHYDT